MYTYIHKSSHTNWLIKINYPILQKKSSNLLIKTKGKEKNVKQVCDIIIKSFTLNQPGKHTSGIDNKDSLLVSIS